MEFFARAVDAYARALDGMAALLVGSDAKRRKHCDPAHRVHPEPLSRTFGVLEMNAVNGDLQAVLGDFCRAFHRLRREVGHGR